jgi:6,7-dimethyl-8-ribityllumazine synthase
MKKKNLSQHSRIPALISKNVKIGIIVSEWNETITDALKEGALAFLSESGIAKEQISVHHVPGSFELPAAAAALFDADHTFDAVICLGCVIQGETRHFEFISQAVANGIMHVSLDYGVPVVFGVLTCDTMKQAQERAGGKHGNKGVEAAHTCLRMLEFHQKIK